MDFDWHPAHISYRGKKLYAVMTVPASAVDAVGQKQIRISARTSDKRQAYDKLSRLELQLQDKVRRCMGLVAVASSDSAYTKLVKIMRLESTVYAMRYDAEYDNNFEVMFDDVPGNDDQVEYAKHELVKAVESLFSPDHSIENFIRWHEKYGDVPPSVDIVRPLLDEALSELNGLFTKPDNRVPTLSSYLKRFTDHLQLRVANGHMKSKSAKARIVNITEFINVTGDKPLVEVSKSEAYSYAASLSSNRGNSTIKTRISDVSTMLGQAEKDGLISTNPFQNLKLSDYGKKTENYTPLSDQQIKAMLTLYGLPSHIRNIWMILAGTGMRLDEVALLTAGQIKVEQDNLYFDLRSASVKNKASQRRVPIAHALQQLVEGLCQGKSPSDRIFDVPLKSDGKSRASEQCNYWMKKVHKANPELFEDGRFTTHSLRGSFKDKLRDAGVDTETNNAILGHDLGGVASTYGRGPSLISMVQAISKVEMSYLLAD